MVDAFHMHPCHVPSHPDFCATYQHQHHLDHHNHTNNHTNDHMSNQTHIHHHSTNGDSVQVVKHTDGGHTEIVHHSNGTVESYKYNSNDQLTAVQSTDGHWYGLGLNVPPNVHDHIMHGIRESNIDQIHAGNSLKW